LAGFFTSVYKLEFDMKKLIAATLVAVALGLLPATAKADQSDVWGSVMVRAYHSDRNAGYNENTLGIGIEYQPTDTPLRMVAGTYNNSFRRQSVYAGVTWLPVKLGPVNFGLMGGTISGYERYDYGFGPMAAGLVVLEGKKYGANLMVVPPVPSAVAGAPTWTFGLQLKYKIKE
jgi:hypothetical protein